MVRKKTEGNYVTVTLVQGVRWHDCRRYIVSSRSSLSCSYYLHVGIQVRPHPNTDTKGNAAANTKNWRVSGVVPLHKGEGPTDSSRTTNVCRSLMFSVGRSAVETYEADQTPRL